MKTKDLKTVRAKRLGKARIPDQRIEINPKIAFGKPIIRGTRITVDFILKLFGQGMNQEEVLAEFPQLEREDLAAALNYAKDIIQEEYIYPLAKTRIRA